jgi:hypothetical protein
MWVSGMSEMMAALLFYKAKGTGFDWAGKEISIKSVK